MVYLVDPLDESLLCRLAEKRKASVRQIATKYVRQLMGIDKVLEFKRLVGSVLDNGPCKCKWRLRIVYQNIWRSAVRNPDTASLLSTVLGVDIETSKAPIWLTEEDKLVFLKPNQKIISPDLAVFYLVYAYGVMPELQQYYLNNF